MSTETAELITIEVAAERLNLHAKTIRRKINQHRDFGHGGWPPGTWVDLNAGGQKATIRIHWQRLVEFLSEVTQGDQL